MNRKKYITRLRHQIKRISSQMLALDATMSFVAEQKSFLSIFFSWLVYSWACIEKQKPFAKHSEKKKKQN